MTTNNTMDTNNKRVSRIESPTRGQVAQRKATKKSVICRTSYKLKMSKTSNEDYKVKTTNLLKVNLSETSLHQPKQSVIFKDSEVIG